jgi:hypothetical protein
MHTHFRLSRLDIQPPVSAILHNQIDLLLSLQSSTHTTLNSNFYTNPFCACGDSTPYPQSTTGGQVRMESTRMGRAGNVQLLRCQFRTASGAWELGALARPADVAKPTYLSATAASHSTLAALRKLQ